jgi:hypothetical protein
MRLLARVLLAAACISVLLPLTSLAQGGPPFRTDDPETPGNLRAEINVGFTGDRGASTGTYGLPEIDANLGLGRRGQLRYILPLAVAETRQLPASGTFPGQNERLLGGLGESLIGLKYRFYEHERGGRWLGIGPKPERKADGPQEATPEPQSEEDEPGATLSASLFPQLILNNPTNSVARGIVPPGPDFLLPIELSGRIGWLRWNGEAGYHFANSHLAQSWIRGLVVGREFTPRTEAYLELYDIQDANRIDGAPKQRETTLALGGRQALNAHRTVVVLLMGGRSFEGVSTASTQPGWIAYAGLRFLIGPIGAGEKLALEVGQKQPGEER